MWFGSRRKEFERLTLPYASALFGFAYWRLASREDAEDAVQEAYLRAYRSFHTFQAGSNVKAWLIKILINVINDSLSKRKHHALLVPLEDCEEFENRDAQEQPGPEQSLIDKEFDPELLVALQQMPSTMVHPLLLREIEEMSYQEIAESLG